MIFTNVHIPHTNVRILQMYRLLTQMYTFYKCTHPSNSNQDTENILNLSFHWENKLIELLCFHSLQYHLSLVLLEAVIQLFC